MGLLKSRCCETGAEHETNQIQSFIPWAAETREESGRVRGDQGRVKEVPAWGAPPQHL